MARPPGLPLNCSPLRWSIDQMLKLTPKERRFWLRWTLGTGAAIALNSLIGPWGFLGGWLPLALVQGWALRGYCRRALPWLIATAMAGALGTTGLVFTFLYTTSAIAGVVAAAAVMGGAQALVLRGLSRHWLWWPVINVAVLVSTAGWMVHWGANTSLMPGAAYGQWWLWGALGLITGLVGGGLKGLALIWALRS